MQDFQRRNNLRKKIYSTPVVLGIFIFAIIFARGAWKIFGKERLSARNLDNSERLLVEAKAREEELEKKIFEAESPSGMEREVREKFSVKKPDEEVVLVVEPKSSEEENKNRSWWSKTKVWFSGLFN